MHIMMVENAHLTPQEPLFTTLVPADEAKDRLLEQLSHTKVLYNNALFRITTFMKDITRNKISPQKVVYRAYLLDSLVEHQATLSAKHIK